MGQRKKEAVLFCRCAFHALSSYHIITSVTEDMSFDISGRRFHEDQKSFKNNLNTTELVMTGFYITHLVCLL